jgi:hypothetical protein
MSSEEINYPRYKVRGASQPPKMKMKETASKGGKKKTTAAKKKPKKSTKKDS